MSTAERHLTQSPGSRASALERVKHGLREFALQDWLVLIYTLELNVVVTAAGLGLGRSPSGVHMALLLGSVITTLVLVRGRIIEHAVLAPLIYRVGIYGPVQASYFFLKSVLPHLSARPYDEELRAIDQGWFGIEPALAFDSWVSSTTTEWFSFFYFSYFWILAFHVVPILLVARNQRLICEAGTGLLTVFCIGHTLYMTVPAYGPYHAMPEAFAHALPPGRFMNMVMDMVRSGGSLLDVFPSLHTAAPLYLAIFSVRNRHLFPFRWSWPVLSFFVANIIISTMFLRWHYLIDVVAGVGLAATVGFGLPWLVQWELARRDRLALMPSWPLFNWRALLPR